jgi:hypothetical protein
MQTQARRGRFKGHTSGVCSVVGSRMITSALSPVLGTTDLRLGCRNRRGGVQAVHRAHILYRFRHVLARWQAHRLSLLGPHTARRATRKRRCPSPGGFEGHTDFMTAHARSASGSQLMQRRVRRYPSCSNSTHPRPRSALARWQVHCLCRPHNMHLECRNRGP